MKRSCLIILLMAYFFSLYSQNVICGDEVFTRHIRNNEEEAVKKMHQINLRVKEYIDLQLQDRVNPQGRSASSSSPASYLIPVVFHIVHNGENYGSGTNISYAQIQSQLAALNAAFAKDYPAYNGQSHPSYAQNTNIQFCLARIAAPTNTSFYNGLQGIEYGVMRYNNPTASSHQLNNSGAQLLLGLTHPAASFFPFAKYLNIWVVTSISAGVPGTVTGYAPTPIMNPFPLDGVIIRSDVTGDNSTSNNFNLGYNLAQGKVLTHEVGHYLNLRHIFEGSCSGTNGSGNTSDACDLYGDYVCDTEPCSTQNYLCSQPVPNTCTANYTVNTTTLDMIENYMSYADDDCQNTFTSGQTDRMSATLELMRRDLWQYANLGATGIMGTGGCIPATLYTDIRAIGNNNCINSPIALINIQSGNAATSWTWSCNGGLFSTANSSSTTVTFANPGLYKILLKVSDGTSYLKDSIHVAVSGCVLDSTKLSRSHWFFGLKCSVDFSSGQPVPNNIALVNNTINGSEGAVSMSDSLGNLLFYSNGKRLWDNTHALVNNTPLFGWNVLLMTPWSSTEGASVSGFISAPLPKRPGKYLLACAPPIEIKMDPNQQAFAKIAYVTYDAVTKTVTPPQFLTHSSINYVFPFVNNTGMSESLSMVPHCNGTDLWLITRGVNTNGAQVFYSFLVTQNGLAPNTPPVISGPHNITLYDEYSTLKSNKAGNKLVCKTANKTVGAIYDFNQATGVVSNPLLLATSSTTVINGFGDNSIIFSPDDQFIFSQTEQGFDQIVAASNTLTKTILYAPSSLTALGSYCEIGPDNNIYLSAVVYSAGLVLAKIINPNSVSGSTFGVNVNFQPLIGCTPNNGMVNFMEAPYPAPVDPLMVSNVSCSGIQLSVHPCWQLYTANWNFGDGSPAVSGSNVTHTYTSNGIYTISLVLAYNGQPLPAITRTVQTFNSALVSGPSVICKGSTFFNTYGTTVISGASYTWTASNATLVGLTNLPNVNVAGLNAGIATLSVIVQKEGCFTTATKTVQVENAPTVNLLTSVQDVCVNETVVLTGSPTGGQYIGPLNGNLFTATSIGTFIFYYQYVNNLGCSNSASVALNVTECSNTGLNNFDRLPMRIFPNPVNEILQIETDKNIVRYSITDMLGRILDEDLMHKEISVGRFGTGVYLLGLRDANGSWHYYKFVKGVGY